MHGAGLGATQGPWEAGVGLPGLTFSGQRRRQYSSASPGLGLGGRQNVHTWELRKVGRCVRGHRGQGLTEAVTLHVWILKRC